MRGILLLDINLPHEPTAQFQATAIRNDIAQSNPIMSTTLELQPPAAPEATTPPDSLTQITGKTTAPLSQSQSQSPSTGQETPKSEQDAVHEFGQLPPTDTGKDAWLFLAACFTLETLVWGAFFLTRHTY